MGGGRIPPFLGGKSRGAFGQPAFFFLKNLSLFSKTIQFNKIEV